jgi:hypothetical protein
MERWVSWLGGKVVTDHTDIACTHVVATSALPTAVKQARQAGKVVVLPAWLLQCWASSNDATQEFDCLGAGLVEMQHRLSILAGCVLLVRYSDLSTNLRTRIRNVANMLGATCVTSLSGTHASHSTTSPAKSPAPADSTPKCTHYLGSNSSDPDYMAAVAQGVIPVMPDWLFQCLASRTWVPETGFAFSQPPKATISVNAAAAAAAAATAVVTVPAEAATPMQPRVVLVDKQAALPSPPPSMPRLAIRLLPTSWPVLAETAETLNADGFEESPTKRRRLKQAGVDASNSKNAHAVLDAPIPPKHVVLADSTASFSSAASSNNVAGSHTSSSITDSKRSGSSAKRKRTDELLRPTLLQPQSELAPAVSVPLEQLVACGQKAQKRRRIMQDLMEKEINYLDNLRCIVEVFLRPLLQENIVSVPLVELIFANVDKLRAFAETIVESLSSMLEDWTDDSTTCLDTVFSPTRLEECLSLYRAYITGHDHAKAALDAQMKKDKPFREFIQASNNLF